MGFAKDLYYLELQIFTADDEQGLGLWEFVSFFRRISFQAGAQLEFDLNIQKNYACALKRSPAM